jgi:hypothetical protein
MRFVKISFFLIFSFVLAIALNFGYSYYKEYKNFNMPAAKPPSAEQLRSVAQSKSGSSLKTTNLPSNTKSKELKRVSKSNAVLGINTADVREDTSSVQFLNLFKSSIPFNETIPWGSSKDVEYDKNGWPIKLNGGQAGTKFLNRLPENTVEDGFFTVLYDGEGEIFYGNDARLIVHRPNKDIIEIKAGKDHILNASLFIKKTNPANYIRNIRILPEGGVCEGVPYIRVKKPEQCRAIKYLSFEDNYNTLHFNPEYLNFMKDFQVVRFMNMSGMTRNPVESWINRNTMEKASWGGKYGSRGAPLEVMVALANTMKADPWFSLPYKANDDYVQKFAEYVKANLDPNLKVYVEYSNEVWNPIFIHHDYAIEQGMKAGLDESKSPAGYKWYSRRSVEVFKIWEEAFGGHQQLIRTMGSWASNQNMSSQVLAFEDAYKYTDAIAIGPYVSAHPKVLRKLDTVAQVFKAMKDKKSKWGMDSIISYIQKQEKVATSFGVDLIAYEGGQHLVDWNTRKVNESPNPLLYAANRDPRMGIIYDELMREWDRAGGKLFVAFSAPRIYSWYGSWGVKEHIRQPRSEAPKYDSLLRYLNKKLHPEKEVAKSSTLNEELDKPIKISYAKSPQKIWDMRNLHTLTSTLKDHNPSDISTSWKSNWDSKHLYFSFAVTDDNIQKGDQIVLTLDSTQKTSADEASNTKATEANKDENQEKETYKPVRVFTFTPSDSLATQTHFMETDTGYLLNIAIPWAEIYPKNRIAKSGDKIGINIVVTDIDTDEKGSRELFWTQENKALPKIELKNL